MASVNLVKQLKARKSGTKTGLAPGATSTGLKGLFQNLSASAIQLDPKEKVLLFLFIMGIGSIFGTKEYLSTFYFPAQESTVRVEMAQLDSQLAQINSKLAAFESVKSDIDSYEKKMGEVREKLSVIESVQKGRNAIVRMVDLVISDMPEALWLGSLRIETSVEKINPALPQATGPGNPQMGIGSSDNSIGNVSVKGFARNLQTVSEYMKKLEGAVFFPKWNLVETREDGGGSLGGLGRPTMAPAETKSFEIQAKVAGLP
jgi:Tfp pilus assembly protein PilN